MKRKRIIFFDKDGTPVSIELKAEGLAVFRKQILKYGTFRHPDGRRNVTFNDKVFDEIIRAFNAGAVEHVPVMLGTHDEEATEKIIGRVFKLEKAERGLYALVEIVDELIVSRIRNSLRDGKGVIDEVSVSLGPVPTDEGEEYPITLTHLAVVTHAWFRGMDSFEELAASLSSENPTAIDMSKEDQDMDREQIIAALKAAGVDVSGMETQEELTAALKKLAESDTDDQPSVEEQVQAALKAAGIEGSLDELKASIEEAKKDNTVLAALKAALNPEDPTPDEVSIADVAKAVATLQASFNEMKEENASLKASNLAIKGGSKIDKLIEEGKITPANKDHYMKLFETDEELFDTLTASLQPVVPTGQSGVGAGNEEQDDYDPDSMSDEDIMKQVERIAASSSMTADDKYKVEA